MQIATPGAVTTLLACPRPPDDLGGQQHDRLAALGRGGRDVVMLAHTVLADHRRASPTDNSDDVYLVEGPGFLSADPPFGV